MRAARRQENHSAYGNAARNTVQQITLPDGATAAAAADGRVAAGLVAG